MRKFSLLLLFIIGIWIGMTTNGSITADKALVFSTTNEQVNKNNEYVNMKIHPSVSYPGDTILVQTSRGGTVYFNGVNYRLQPLENSYITFIPISIDYPAGEYKINWYPEEIKKGNEILTYQNTINTKVIIRNKKFSTQYLEVTAEQEQMTQNTEKINEDRRKFYHALSKPIGKPLFSGAFLTPLNGPITTMFGYTRYVNGVLDDRHLAIDIAAEKGTPVLAPNNGKVVLADFLYLSGNRVILDHGDHLFTSFSHMSKLNVKEGQFVEKGAIIGWVGSTGFSTGPHLHHAVYIYGQAVNPELFFGTNPLKW